MGGGAWPFLVGGVICLVNSVNEREGYVLVCCSLTYRAPLGESSRFDPGARSLDNFTVCVWRAQSAKCLNLAQINLVL